jgi:uncharacterized membrane protein YiaA
MKKYFTRTLSAQIAFGVSVWSVVLLISLLFLSPEFDPALRPISDYALGNYGWVLSQLFFSWAISSWALVIALAPHLKKMTGKIGLFFLVLAGFGEFMGGLFNVTHPLHGMAFFIGVPCLPIAALLITSNLVKLKPWSSVKNALRISAHLTWISIVLMAASIGIMFIWLTNAGITPGPEVTEIPDSVIVLSGWANRFLVVSYCAWVSLVAYYTLKHKNS